VKAIAERITEPLLTCEAVLAFVRDGLVRPAFVVGEHLPRPPDLTDLCLIRLSELHRRAAFRPRRA
jgi:hypothetical protein